MSKEVKISRKEAKRAQTALAKQPLTTRQNQTLKQHKKESRKRNKRTKTVDFLPIFQKYGIPNVDALEKIQEELLNQYRSNSIPECHYPEYVFDPQIKDISELPIEPLSHKEMALPTNFIPTNHADLLRLCRRFIIRNEDESVIYSVVEGWPGRGDPASKLQQHVDDLLELRTRNEVLYEKIVGGQHRTALEKLIRGESISVSDAWIDRVLVRHSLLWCTNDLQMNLGRNVKSEINPLETLIYSHFRQLQPERIVNDLRPLLLLMLLLLRDYTTTDEEDGGRVPKQAVPDEPAAKAYERRLKRDAAKRGIDLLSLRGALDNLVPELLELAHQDDRFREILLRPVASAELAKHFAGIWYSGLSNVQSAAVTVLRYVQGESDIAELVRTQRSVLRGEVAPPQNLAMPAFNRGRLKEGWLERAQLLLHLYRQALLHDKDMPKDVPSKNAGTAAINKAAEWLEKRPQRAIEDHDERAGEERRTLHLLDIIPEARLWR